MTQKPWEQQPPEPSRIITPRDTITIVIDNTSATATSPPNISMQTSRPLPMPVICAHLATLIAQMQVQILQALAQAAPIAAPGAGPIAVPPGMRGNDAKT